MTIPRQRRFELNPALLLLAPSIWLVVLSLRGRSQVPLYFGRWSTSLLAFNAAQVLGVLLTSFLLVARKRWAAFLGLLMLIGFTFLASSSIEVMAGRFGAPLTWVARSCLGILLLWLGFEGENRANRERFVRASAITAIVILGSTVVDAVGLTWVGSRTQRGTEFFRTDEFREPIDHRHIPHQSVAIVGDSFVWGAGVEVNETFPALMRKEMPVPIFNLGVVGAGLSEYLTTLRQLPPRDVTVLGYYMNDMPARVVPSLKLRMALLSLGRTSLFARLLADVVGMSFFPNVDTYLPWIVGDYDKTDPTFEARWRMATDQITKIGVEAARGAQRPPLFVIFPLMWDFSKYPLTAAHTDLAVAAQSAGFEVVDLLPIFAKFCPDGRKEQVSPTNNHFNAKVHRRVADVLAERIIGQGRSAALGWSVH